MERLILMRHGEAERPQPGLEDFDRALDAEGRSESRLMGRVLAKAGIVPDLALVSASRRTLETWKAVAEGFPGTIAVVEDQGLYAASASRLAVAVADAAARGRTIILVGHNPGIHQYGVHLAKQAGASDKAVRPLYERFPTGSLAVFAMGGPAPEFERLFLVRDYRDEVR
jgi:phosphohistidine phosphatase